MRDLDNVFLEKRIQKLEKSGGGTASNTSYDNTESGLTANNVQTAIDEVHEEVENIRHHYSSEEKIVGEWIDGSPIYEKVYIIDFGIPSTAAFDLTGFNSSNYGNIISGCIIRTGNGSLGAYNPLTIWKGDTYLRARSIDSLAKEGNMYLILQYTKS